ncbi:MAG: hypothetical protein JWL73_2997 [Actinomycetia bacterium]|nr:hypothetical protein [Actinomycetes bacterium]
MLDFLVSADLLIDDFTAVVERAQTRLGFGAPRDNWFGGAEGRGFEVVFLRAQPSLKAAPTRLEIMASRSIDPSIPMAMTLPHMPGLRRHQEAFPVRTHGTVFATSEMQTAIDRVRELGIRHWLDAKNELAPHDRLWIGVSEDGKDEWIPGDDGGLLIELVESASIPGVVESAELPDPTDLSTMEPGALVRIVARRWLVPDVDSSRDALQHTFGVEIDEAIPTGRGGDGRVLTIRPDHPRSAVVEMIQPSTGTEEAALVDRHGPLPWRIIVAVNGLDAKREDLERRGTPYENRADHVTGADSVAVDPTILSGVPMSFVDVP